MISCDKGQMQVKGECDVLLAELDTIVYSVIKNMLKSCEVEYLFELSDAISKGLQSAIDKAYTDAFKE